MKFLMVFLLALPGFAFSQEVKVNVYDKFIKQQRIELEPVIIPAAGKDRVGLAFSSVSSTFYLLLSGSGWGASTIDVDNPIIFLFSNDSTVTLHSTSLQSYEPGITQSTYKHQYYVKAEDIQAFSQYDLVGIRKYSFKDFTDLSIPREVIPKIRSLGAMFLRELRKANVIKTLKPVDINDVAKFAGDTVKVCGKVFATHYDEATQGQPTLLDVRASATDPLLNVIIPGATRALFNNAPEKIYANKDVCVSGTVKMVSSIPQVLIYRRDQVKIKSAITAAETPLFVDDTMTVVGKIFSGKFFNESQSQPTLLNMGAIYPNNPVTIVIQKDDLKFFADHPETVYTDKTVSVTGKITLYNNKPQIIIRNSGQIKIVGDTSPSAAAF